MDTGDQVEFDPNSDIVKLCLQGMNLEAKEQPEQAGELFTQAWNQATNDFEKFLAAYYLAWRQESVRDKLEWFEMALQLAIKSNSPAVTAAYPVLYSEIANRHEELGDHESAKKNRELADSFNHQPADPGPFYHGTRADLRINDLLTAGGASNYQADLVMNHIYFTALANGAGLAAALAKGDGRERVYVVEPTGAFENDPNVTNKKFPGNPTRSYRSEAPLRIVGEMTDWNRQTPEQLRQWREKLANTKGEIIN